MGSHGYAAPLVVEAGRSRWLQRLTGAVFACGLLAIWLAGLPLSARIGLTGLLALYAVWVRRRPELAGGRVRLRWEADGQWWWEAGDEADAVSLCGDSVVTPWVTILTFKGETGGVRSLVLLPDSADAETLRRLRVRLRLEAKAGRKHEPA